MINNYVFDYHVNADPPLEESNEIGTIQKELQYSSERQGFVLEDI